MENIFLIDISHISNFYVVIKKHWVKSPNRAPCAQIYKMTISYDRYFYAEKKTEKHVLEINRFKIINLQILVGSGG